MTFESHMDADIKTTSLAWQQIAYDWKTYFTVPSRVSPGEVAQYREWLKQINKHGRALRGLVLGATPELRDAFFELGYMVCSIDINLDMFLAMDELLQHKNTHEVIVRANWLENPLADNYFDVVVGDAVLPNVPWEERSRLLSEVKRVLKADGIFLTRAFCVPDEKSFSNVEAILEYFSNKAPVAQSATEMILELLILTYDPEDHLGSLAKAKAALEEYHKEHVFRFSTENLQKIHDIVWDFWCGKFVDKVFVFAYRGDEESDYKKHFEITDVFEAKDHDYSQITPMYFLRRL